MWFCVLCIERNPCTQFAKIFVSRIFSLLAAIQHHHTVTKSHCIRRSQETFQLRPRLQRDNFSKNAFARASERTNTSASTPNTLCIETKTTAKTMPYLGFCILPCNYLFSHPFLCSRTVFFCTNAVCFISFGDCVVESAVCAE